MEGSAEDGMKGVEVLRSRGLPSKVLDQVGVSCLAANNVNRLQHEYEYGNYDPKTKIIRQRRM